MTQRHRLLKRQLARCGVIPTAELDRLLDAVSHAYEANDHDRLLLERSLELTSEELLALNESLRAELRGAEAARRDLRRALDASTTGMAVLTNGRIAYANRALAGWLETPAEALEGAEALSFVVEGTLEPGTTRLRAPSGRETLVAIQPAEPLVWDGQSADLLVARDLTTERAMEERLAQADRLASLGRVAAAVAHEINNPLTYVISNLHYLAEELVDRPAAFEALRDAREGADRVRRIVRDLKILARPEDDGAPRIADLRAVVDAALALTSAEIHARARLVREEEPVGLVHGENGRLVQVLVNLLVNAAQAIPCGEGDHEIRVRIAADGDAAVVEVSDTGTGIAPAIRARLFEAFVTTKPAGVGTGLGLSICRALLEQCGGTIEVADRAPRGTRFTVRLRRAGDGTLPSPALDSGPSGVRARVLIVDDEPLVAAAMSRVLARSHHVRVAATADDARAVLRGDVFDVVLCDLAMAGVSGADLFHSFADAPAIQARFVFVTGGVVDPAVASFLETTVRPVLRKPVDTAELRRLVVQMTKEHRRGAASDQERGPSQKS